MDRGSEELRRLLFYYVDQKCSSYSPVSKTHRELLTTFRGQLIFLSLLNSVLHSLHWKVELEGMFPEHWAATEGSFSCLIIF